MVQCRTGIGLTLTLYLLTPLTMFPAAGVLVLLLYLLLLHELLSHLWWSDGVESSKGTAGGGGAGGGGGGGMYRPKAHTQQRRHPHTLDALWRRMKQATDSFKVNGLKHALITTTMAEARAEARRVEQERLASTMAKD